MSTTDSPAPTERPDHCAQRSPYHGTVLAVGTRHGKQRQFDRPFADILGARLHTPDDLDTDRFGTFAGDRPRRTGAVAAARAKARLAMDVTSLNCALASEASYGPLPHTGVPGHQEILLFCDTSRGIEVVEGYASPEVPGAAAEVTARGEISGHLLAGLPGQALIVRPARLDDHSRSAITKGITDLWALRAAVAAAAAASPDGRAVVEPDLRAHHNPSRRRVLRRLGESMARRLATRCPACDTPGFGRVDSAAGRPCAICATPTALTLAEIHGCCRCDFSASRTLDAGPADPRDCPLCNP